MPVKILVLNLGSTSTKVAYFEDLEEVYAATLRLPTEEVSLPLIEQVPARLKSIYDFMDQYGLNVKALDVISARGGLLKPIDGGTYGVNEQMLEELKAAGSGEHASNLSAILAHEIGSSHGIQATITDPVVVDELMDEVRVTGIKGIERASIFHALNQKAVARDYAASINRRYEDINVIVIHMGGGVTAGAHMRGRVIDVNDGLYGDGPMSPTRSGALPNRAFAKYILENELTIGEVEKAISKEGGFISLKGTGDALKIEQEALSGDQYALDIYKALSVQIAKEAGARAAVLKGQIDAILFTGGLAYSEFLIDLIRPYIEFLGEIHVYPGEKEMLALAEGAYRVKTGEEILKEYK
ncbi:butyrate kinase [Lacicoccus alkaliphilus]|uniref:Probable butyrate kinase n=1 Tax=Lacicoccus alkaliphilus DSM 16010 TaxID=1123231 RepID=A0A1M7BEY8_9BACL|nr:butyrate kinase [Salinicoccus alkaliphilus]SHL53562.1 butyrate kinase [Salinicoccus alkaliphilus DSM 16010]